MTQSLYTAPIHPPETFSEYARASGQGNLLPTLRLCRTREASCLCLEGKTVNNTLSGWHYYSHVVLSSRENKDAKFRVSSNHTLSYRQSSSLPI